MRSVHQRPMTDEYSISGTTFAPDGFIYDAGGLQVNSIFVAEPPKESGPHAPTVVLTDLG